MSPYDSEEIFLRRIVENEKNLLRPAKDIIVETNSILISVIF